MRQVEFSAYDEADHGARIAAAELDRGQRVIAVGHAAVDRITRLALELDHVAVFGESRRAQRLDVEPLRHESYPANEPGLNRRREKY